ncbi:MAG: hypothetical protein ACOC9B_00925 [Chloroflexota bacterium]
MFVAFVLLLSGGLLFLGPAAAGPGRQWPTVLAVIVGLVDIMQAVVLMI